MRGADVFARAGIRRYAAVHPAPLVRSCARWDSRLSALSPTLRHRGVLARPPACVRVPENCVTRDLCADCRLARRPSHGMRAARSRQCLPPARRRAGLDGTLPRTIASRVSAARRSLQSGTGSAPQDGGQRTRATDGGQDGLRLVCPHPRASGGFFLRAFRRVAQSKPSAKIRPPACSSAPMSSCASAGRGFAPPGASSARRGWNCGGNSTPSIA